MFSYLFDAIKLIIYVLRQLKPSKKIITGSCPIIEHFKMPYRLLCQSYDLFV